MPNFADASETVLSFVPEVTWGTTPPAAPAFQVLRFVSDNLVGNRTTQQSNEITPSADVSDLIRLGEGGGGDIAFELSYDPNLQSLMEAALRKTWGAAPAAGVAQPMAAGTEKKSFTFQKKYVGAADIFFRFPGARIGNMALTIQARQPITGSFTTLAKGYESDDAELAGATYVQPGGNPVMSAPEVATITVGSISAPLYFTDLSFTLNNNLREQPYVGDVFNAGIGYGQRQITGSLVGYLEDLGLYDLFQANTFFALSYEIEDGLLNKYKFEFPRCKMPQGQVPTPGNNQDVMFNGGFQALRDPTAGTSFIITRTPHA